jgi:glucose-6-phosphate isomerase
VDTRAVIAEAASVWDGLCQTSADNAAVLLGSALSLPDRDIALLVSHDDTLPGLGDWIEQLVAESTGKDGKGILPVVVSPNAPELAGQMDDVVSISLSGSAAGETDAVISAPLGAQFLLWEYSTAFCGYLRQLNPFDQPDVESAKVAARGLLDQQPEEKPADVSVDGVEMWLSPGLSGTITSLAAAWQVVSDAIGPSGYLGVHLYCDRLAHPQMDRARNALVERVKRPVTVGFGPRFLHSTGQFHKGGTPDGVFVQVLVQPQHDIQIPGYPFDFATLVNAQALGDRDVLVSRGRPVLTVRVADEASLVKFLAAAGHAR